ncbi:hypothetical protein J1N35_032169 [Gossypium stocksii]|uniref:Uncharacterized protein n=1 Tax=Gossypium stocksii TaxID=47602 RepID=A0A9D3V3Y4_9ROSI|nr:hypothetical protein J1N35_032169 [Gossypium stocksii]
MEEINWDTLLLEANLPDFRYILDNEPKQVTKLPPQPCLTWNPDEETAVSSWIGEIKKQIMLVFLANFKGLRFDYGEDPVTGEVDENLE